MIALRQQRSAADLPSHVRSRIKAQASILDHA
jgi:hypothetical protein